ncbi:hypothetical protein ColKHC_05627 [Colletotrichum higginsianum]|nr:hypothetical protein ColKHC_05627 [Colletotrichum higginsianum]
MLSTARIATRQAAARRMGALPVSAARAGSTWANVPQGPPTNTGITEAFKADKFEAKINLGVGAYRDDQGKPYVLPSVRAAEEKVIAAKLNKEYAGITGVPEFTKSAAVLAYGADSSALDRLAITQSISGTGALRIGGAFLARFYPGAKNIYIPTPRGPTTAPSSPTLGSPSRSRAQGLHLPLPRLRPQPHRRRPDPEQWRQISDAVKASGHYAFFDMAYQGFASGNTDTDAFAVRHFVEQGHNVCLAQSFAKNMGLYGERVGAFSIVAQDAEERKRLDSQVKILVRPMYSNPPVHGARIASTILNDAALNRQWLGEVKGMADRIITMRALLKENLEKLGSAHDWSHITSQIGMFAYTGLTPSRWTPSPRSTPGNVGRLAEAIYKVKG